ncbi:uncharacterized protein LOC123528917 [Mercenaria mercenaria]|uniref:uncharacterized protein LOC123528917 n=1 Tax=Mercenaria mercenaria TaxID=6596 RepID=UPI00234F5FC6|nr:uncharacterized protein LOC123528917 [Mercenaria mercenaria]
MRNIFRKGKRVIIGYLIIMVTVIAVSETLLGKFFLKISPYSMQVPNVLLPTKGVTSYINQSVTQQQKIPTSRNIIFNSRTKQQSQHSIKIPTKAVKNQITSTVSSFRGTTWDPSSIHRKAITKNCTMLVDPSIIKTPFKFYIYDLPTKFNYDIQRLFTDERKYSFCYNLDYCGMGEELYQYSDKGTQIDQKMEKTDGRISVRNTHQFALEVIIHYKLLHSPYRTTNPDQADMFYIPAYTGLQCLTFSGNSQDFVNELFHYLETKESKHFNSGKPHFSTLSKIQREQASQNCPTLRHSKTEAVTFIAIEKESNPYWFRNQQIHGKSIIVAPYPSYIHFINQDKEKTLFEYHSGLRKLNESRYILKVPPISERKMLLFLAAGMRRSNFFRAKLLDQFAVQTDKGPDDFYESVANHPQTEQVMLITSECSVKHRTTTIPWMQRSVFCLQPPGDSPTRKSIYDSILSGCIPILFTNQYKTEYPFERVLNYESFTFTIDEKLISRYNKTVIEIVKGISEEKTKSLYNNLVRVSKWFQYSLPDGDAQWEDDAVTLILDELAFRNNITNVTYIF